MTMSNVSELILKGRTEVVPTSPVGVREGPWEAALEADDGSMLISIQMSQAILDADIQNATAQNNRVSTLVRALVEVDLVLGAIGSALR
jgi:hypothetical protein